tara:strand:- start:638 stop:2572 length:1935 start_codon:yes stop_codon:yes gene_type:complete
MLAAFRSIVRSPILLVLIIGPLIVGFAIFGVSDIFVRTGDAVALVGPERVTQVELARAYNQRLQREQVDNPTLTSETARLNGLGDTVLSELIIGARIRAMANDLNLAVSDEQVVNEIDGYEVFRDPVTGRHDNAAYSQYLSNQRISAEQFEDNVREDLLRRQLVDALFAGLRTPEGYASAIQEYQNERRSFRAIVVPPQAAGDVGEPDDAALQTVIDENPQYFTIPERRSFTLVRFRVEDFTRDVVIDEADIRDQYDYEIDSGQLGEPATRSFTQMRFEDADTARAAADRLNAGERATDIAADLGVDAPFSQTDRQAYQIPDEALADALFSMSEGEAAAVEGRLGWFVVRVTAAQDAEIPAFETRRADIRQLMARSEAEDLMYDAMGAYESAISGGATLEEAAEAANIPYEYFGPTDAQFRDSRGFPAQYRADSGQWIAANEEQPEVIAAVFEQTPGFETELDPYGDGDYFALRVDSVTASSIRDLDDAREDAATVWRLQTVDARLEDIVNDARARAQAGEALDSIAASIPGARVEAASLTRSETAAPFGRDAISAAFFMEEGDVQRARSADNRSHLVLVLDEITSDADTSAEDLFELRSLIAEQFQADLDRSLSAALAAKYPERVDATLRDQALGVIDASSLQ